MTTKFEKATLKDPVITLAKDQKKPMKSPNWEKIAEATGKGLVAILTGVGQAMVENQEQKESLKEEIINLKNKKAEEDYQNTIVHKDDLDNLRNHVLRIVKNDNSSFFGASYYGKELLTNEHRKTDKENRQEFYAFIIKYGI